jgi:virulence factor Mce-like protein
MKRILIGVAAVLAAAAFIVTATASSSAPSATGTYKIELDNAFGLVSGEDFKVGGVVAGSIRSIDLPQACDHGQTTACRALVTVHVTQGGFGSFHADAFCESRPQSLIGEYFLNCTPGNSGPVLPPGSVIPVTHTQSTIPADLLANIMKLPYRERLTLIINELGAGVAGQSGDLQAAIQRAVPALTQTDNLLTLLANDSRTIQDLTASSDSVVTALANNGRQVQRFITEADNTATATATQQANLKSTFAELPGFLEQLRPALARLGQATDANTPVLANLNAASAGLDRLFTELPSFSRSALPALQSLGQASVTGRAAVQAAGPAIQHLNQFATPTPELAQNLAIVLHDLNDRGRAVERDPRSPGGQGYTGLEAMLQYVFNQTLAIDYFGPYGHELAVDAFVSPMCSGLATPATIAANLRSFGPAYRSCYSWLGPNQPGVNETDPSNPSACVPDPGGAPLGLPGPATTACRLAAAADRARAARAHASTGAAPATSTPIAAATGGGSGAATGTGAPPGGGSPLNLQNTLGQLVGALTGSGSSVAAGSGQAPSSTTSGPNGGSGNSTQALLNYLLSP